MQLKVCIEIGGICNVGDAQCWSGRVAKLEMLLSVLRCNKMQSALGAAADILVAGVLKRCLPVVGRE